MKVSGFLVFLFFSLWITGCAGDSSADEDFHPGITSGRQALLQISDGDTYDFGSLEATLVTTHSFTITNHGSRTAENINFTVPSGYSITTDSCGNRLAANSSCAVSIRFSPISGSSYSGDLSLSYQASSSKSAVSTRALSGRGLSVWTWISGSNTVDPAGVYGVKGTAASTNFPGGRHRSGTWRDSSGVLWLFGGVGIDSNSNIGYLNDLWKFDGTNWTWVSGADTRNQTGVPGVQGVPAGANIPGGRQSMVTWIDSTGDFWLFGGWGYDSTGATGYLNDLWKFDGTNWTWVLGDTTINNSGVYGIKGTADPANFPGGKQNAVSWIDSSNNLWLFGGFGYDKNGNTGRGNDLWKFNGTEWTWVSGNDVRNQIGTYGTKGVAAGTNVPGARSNPVSWKDSSGNFWLGRGDGLDSVGGVVVAMNDLWKFNGTQWTWISGSDTGNQSPSYGSKGTPATSNIAGSGYDSTSWVDSSNNLWFLGGEGIDSAAAVTHMNELWKFDGTNWTWVSGSITGNQSGIYGTKAIAASLNVPGSRTNSLSWTDSSGNLWLFGGSGYDSVGNLSYLNDLWRFTP